MKLLISLLLFSFSLPSFAQSSVEDIDYSAVQEEAQACVASVIRKDPALYGYLIWDVKRVLAEGSGLPFPSLPQNVKADGDIKTTLRLLSPLALFEVADCVEAAFPLARVRSEKRMAEEFRNHHQGIHNEFYSVFLYFTAKVAGSYSVTDAHQNPQYVDVVMKTQFMEKIQYGQIKTLDDEAAIETIQQSIEEIALPVMRDRLIHIITEAPMISTAAQWRDLL